MKSAAMVFFIGLMWSLFSLPGACGNRHELSKEQLDSIQRNPAYLGREAAPRDGKPQSKLGKAFLVFYFDPCITTQIPQRDAGLKSYLLKSELYISF